MTQSSWVEQPVVVPVGELETTLAQIWSDTLGIEPISRDDTFADLGGTSLDAERVLLALRGRLALQPSAELLTGRPTLAELAARIEDARRARFRAGRSTATALAVAESSEWPALFCFAGAGATAVSFLPLAAAVAGSRTVYGFHAAGFTSRGIPDWTVSSAARRHVADLLRFQPEGPYTLIGHSFGGHIALAAAELLQRHGHVVRSVYLLDTVLRTVHGGSVAEYRGRTQPAPSLWQQLRTHLLVAGAGLVQYEASTQQAVFWEQSIRVQNRHRVRSLPQRVQVLVTEENRSQAELWRELADKLGDPARVTVHRVDGDHLGVLNEPRRLRELLALIEQQEAQR